MECLYEALKRAGDRILGSFPSVVPLVLHSSVSYLGFFVNDSPADVIREFAATFATEASVLAGRQPASGTHRAGLMGRDPVVSGAVLATRDARGGSQGSRVRAVP